VTVAVEHEIASLLGEFGISSLRLGKLGDSKEGNLHTFKQTDDGHEHKEEDNRDQVRNTVPHGSLALKESGQGHCEAICQDGE
jgi:hypothetical protein